jgi:hypothetical protein
MNSTAVKIMGPIENERGRGYYIDVTVNEDCKKPRSFQTYKMTSNSFFMPVSDPNAPATGATKPKRKRRK